MSAWLPSVIAAEYESGYRLRIRFGDGAESVVDFEGWLEGPMFEPLRDVSYFRRFFIEGGTVTWPNGADVAPETLYAAAAAEVRAEQ
jgi:hypothetical protein